MERTGALFAVAQQAAAVEPLVTGFWQQGRDQSRRVQELFWSRMAADGLLRAEADRTWLTDTSSVLSGAEGFLLYSRITGGDLDAYQRWLEMMLTQLVAGQLADERQPPA